VSDPGFWREDETSFTERFLCDGHLVLPVEDRPLLDRMQQHAAASAARLLGLAEPGEPGPFLDGVHRELAPDRLNAVRLGVIAAINEAVWFRPAYFAQARRALEILVGNELAMQRRVNLSIQLPDDTSSLLPVHADTWSGDSPFEIVLWIPLVDCFRTKSMFLLPPKPAERLNRRLHEYAERSSEDLFRDIEPDVAWLDVPYGRCLLFNQTLPHGNRVNRETTTRWSMNCRFKGVFTPYADKKPGEFFEPITLRAVSRLGMAYALPGGFDE